MRTGAVYGKIGSLANIFRRLARSVIAGLTAEDFSRSFTWPEMFSRDRIDRSNRI
jgi:hypothetical protein